MFEACSLQVLEVLSFVAAVFSFSTFPVEDSLSNLVTFSLCFLSVADCEYSPHALSFLKKPAQSGPTWSVPNSSKGSSVLRLSSFRIVAEQISWSFGLAGFKYLRMVAWKVAQRDDWFCWRGRFMSSDVLVVSSGTGRFSAWSYRRNTRETTQ